MPPEIAGAAFREDEAASADPCFHRAEQASVKFDAEDGYLDKASDHVHRFLCEFQDFIVEFSGLKKR